MLLKVLLAVLGVLLLGGGAFLIRQQGAAPTVPPGSLLLPTGAPMPALPSLPSLFRPPTVPPSPEPTLAPPTTTTLSVEVRAVRIDPITKDETPVARWLLDAAALQCPARSCDAGSVCPAPVWAGPTSTWCKGGGVSATNLPVRTDAAGRATLVFSGSPAPASAGFRQPSFEGDLDATPLVYIRLSPGNFRAFTPMVLAPGSWRVVVNLP